jgi:hypothetical protein
LREEVYNEALHSGEKKIRRQVFTHLDSFKINPTYNSDGALINCLLQPELFYYRIQKYMREEFNLLIKSCGIWTVPATETKSIRLQADARVVIVFARHLDNFVVT